MTEDNFDWGVLGKDWWMEAMETTRASLTQSKFACARHAGATRTKAAEMSGYSATDAQALRTAGSRADDTKAVQDMLVMASAASVGATDDPYTVAEARQKIGRMVKTSLDPSTVIKGTELLAKLDQVDRDRGATDNDYDRGDGFLGWRVERDFLLCRNGASAYVLMHGIDGHLLHDTYSLLMKEEFGPEIWSRLYAKLNDDARKRLDEHLYDLSYQLEARKTIWGEIGKKPPGPVDPQAVDWRVKRGHAPDSNNETTNA